VFLTKVIKKSVLFLLAVVSNSNSKIPIARNDTEFYLNTCCVYVTYVTF